MALTDMFNNAVQSVKNFWQTFDVKQWSDNMGGNYSQAIQAGLYFGGFFLVGFFFRKYFKILFISLVILVLVLKFMEYNSLASINWESTKTFFGVQPTTDIHVVINTCLAWIKNNIVLFVASCVGFLIGYKLG